jgi:sec-independent protein translocase protein TatA
LVILLIGLVFFGSKKIKTLGSDLGDAVRGFKKAMDAGDKETVADARPPVQQIPARDAEFSSTTSTSTVTPEQKPKA